MSRSLKLFSSFLIFIASLLGVFYVYESAHEEARAEFDSKYYEKKQELISEHGSQNVEEAMKEFRKEEIVITRRNVFLIALGCFTCSTIIVYLILSKLGRKPIGYIFKNNDKLTSFVLGIIILSCLATYGVLFLATDLEDFEVLKSDSNVSLKLDLPEVEKDIVIYNSEIDLSNYEKNVAIEKGGSYDIKGAFSHTLIIDSDEDVTLNLNGVTIESDDNSAIAHIGNGSLVLSLNKNTNNELLSSNDKGASLYSKSKLSIEGSGTLYISSPNLSIEAESGYVIDGGTLIAIGRKKPSLPSNDSSQKTLYLNLEETIKAKSLGTIISNGKRIISFKIDEDFKTVLLSTSKIGNEKPHFYKNGKISGKSNGHVYLSGKYTPGEEVSIEDVLFIS